MAPQVSFCIHCIAVPWDSWFPLVIPGDSSCCYRERVSPPLPVSAAYSTRCAVWSSSLRSSACLICILFPLRFQSFCWPLVTTGLCFTHWWCLSFNAFKLPASRFWCLWPCHIASSLDWCGLPSDRTSTYSDYSGSLFSHLSHVLSGYFLHPSDYTFSF